MRATVHEWDTEGYIGRGNGGRFEVLLNGRKIDKVISADEELGYLIRAQTDENGKTLVDRKRGIFCKEPLYGKVSIVDTWVKRHTDPGHRPFASGGKLEAGDLPLVGEVGCTTYRAG